MIAVRDFAWAMGVDGFHRAVTANMVQLRRMVRTYVRELRLPAGSPILDFGCGTGLYAGLFLEDQLRYHGFDIDTKFLRYARALHPRGRFHSNWLDVAAAAPYSLVVANCCFHHMNDDDASSALARIRSVLSHDGAFLFVDHIPPTQSHVTIARRAYRRLERGHHIRSVDEYLRLIEPGLKVRERSLERSYVLSLCTRYNPVFNELMVLQCGLEPRLVSDRRHGEGSHVEVY